MEQFKRNPIFYTVLLVLAAVGVSGLWYLSQQKGRLGGLKAAYEAKSAQYARYVAAQPSPTRSNLRALDWNYAELYATFEEAMKVLNLNTYDRETFFGQAPESRADWSFVTHRYIEVARRHAQRSGVGLPANPQFGVSRFARSTPAAGEMERLHRQMAMMSSILGMLFDSGIESFVSIQRGAVTESARGRAGGTRRAEAGPMDGDEFALPAAASLAVPGVIDAYAFRVSFRGQTIALRRFLNYLAYSSLPFAVRGVEVELAAETGGRTDAMAAGANPLAPARPERGARSVGVPIISENRSLFIVTLEFLDLEVDIDLPNVTLEGGSDA